MDGPAGRPADNPPNSDGLAVYHRTVPELTVQVHWQPRPPLWQRFGLDPGADPKSPSGTVANTSKEYGNTTGLYNNHCKYSELCNQWYPVWSAHDFKQHQSCNQHMKTWVDQSLRRQVDNFKIESFHIPAALQMLLLELDYRLDDENLIEDDSHIIGKLYLQDIFKYIWFLLAHLPFQVHLNFEPVHLTDADWHHIYSQLNIGNWWWDTQD